MRPAPPWSREAVRRLRRIGGDVKYSELTRRYFEQAGCVRMLSADPARTGAPPGAARGHLGAIRRAGERRARRGAGAGLAGCGALSRASAART